MLLPKPLRKFVAIFRGEVSPVLILISVTLGFWFGLTPGWYGIHVVLLAAVLILNVHIGIFLMSAAAGKALCFAAAPVLFHVGRGVHAGLSPVLDRLAALPIVGITDFARYSVAGSLLLGPVLGLAGGLLLARSVSTFRKAWLTFEENSDAFRKWQANRWVRLLDRLLVGKRAQDVRAALERKPKVVRLAGVIATVVLLLASAAGLYFVGGDRLAELVTDTLSRTNGAEVNVAKLDLSPFAGRVAVEGLQVTDPAKPTHNRLAVGELTADAGIWDLLRGRLVMDNVTLAAVTMDRPRAQPGRVLSRPSVTETEEPRFEPQRFELPDVNVAELDKLESYFADAENVREWCQRVASWLPESKEEAPPPSPTPQRYLEYLTVRAPVPPTPTVLVKRVVLEDVLVPVEPIGNSTITCTNLSDAPAAAGLPVTIAIESRERPTSLTITAHYERPGGGAEISGTIGDVELAALQEKLSPNNPVVFEAGQATATLSGKATRQDVDLAIQVQTKGMQARTAGSGVLELDPEIASEAIKLLEEVQTTLRLVGPITQPRLVFDGPALTDEFRDALVRAGKDQLARRLGELTEGQLPGGVPEPGALVDDPLGAAQEGLAGLLGDKEGQDEPEEGDDDEEKKNPLDDLRKRLGGGGG